MSKKRVMLTIATVLIVCLLAVSLTACMKIRMRKSSIVDRLEDIGATIEYQRTTPMTKGGEKEYSFEDLIYSTKAYNDVENDDSEIIQELYVIFCGSDSAADWAEDACKKYIEDNPDITVKWNTYRYERVIMCGYYELLTEVRTY